MTKAAARHAEIARRYSKKAAARPPVSITVLRIADLRRLFTDRYGLVLPDDDAGRDDAFIMANHLAWRPNADRRILAWLSLWCPWMTAAEAQTLSARVIAKPLLWCADTLAKRLHLKEADRARLKITTIGAIDLTKAQRDARRRDRKQLRKQNMRRAKGAKPRREYEAGSINRNEPWKAVGMSRRSWYRAGKPCSRGDLKLKARKQAARTELQLKEAMRLLRHRYGSQLPNNDAGREAAFVVCSLMAQLERERHREQLRKERPVHGTE